MRKSVRYKEAFTLVELLVVVAAMCAIAFAIYGTFSSGARIWQKARRISPMEDADIFFDRFSSDVRNGLKITGLAFSGDDGGFECPTLVSSARLGARTVGKVRYRYDQKGGIYREELDYSSICNGREGIGRQVLAGAGGVLFRYYIFDDKKREYVWLDEYSGPSLPLAVMVELEMSNGEKSETFRKAVSIPVSG